MHVTLSSKASTVALKNEKTQVYLKEEKNQPLQQIYFSFTPLWKQQHNPFTI